MAVFTNELKLDTGPFLSALKKVQSEAASSATKVEGELKGIDATIDISGAVNSLNKLEAEAKTAGGKIGAGIKSGLGDLGSSITGGLIGGGVAAGVTKGAELIISGIKSVIDVGSQFETALAGVSAVTGVTGAGLDDLGTRAQDLAARFGGAATTQLGAFQTILSKFGPDLAKTPEALSAVSENVNILAKAAGLDAKGAVDALSNSMLQFGVDASDPARLAAESGRFINVLAAGAKVGAAEIPQVAEAILQAGVAAKGANISFEETNAAIQALAIGGKVGSEAGVALRNVMGLLIKTSGEGEKALNKVGLSASGLGKTLTTQGLAAALEELQTGVNKLGTDAEKAAFKATLFGTENASAAGILLDQVGNIKLFTKQVSGTTEAFDQAKTNMATFAEFSSRVSASLGNVQIAIFQGFQDFADLITGVLQPVIAPLVDNIGGAFERIWSILKPILAAIGAVVITSVVVPIQFLGAQLNVLVGLFNRAFDTLKRSIQPAIDAVKRLFGIDGALGEGIDMMELFKQALAFVGESFTLIADIVVEVGGLIFEVLLTPLQAVISVIAGVITKVKEWFGASKDSNEENKKGKGILETLREAFANIKGTISGVTEAFREIKTVVNEFFSALAELDIKKALAAFTGFGDRVAKAYDRGFDSVQKLKDEQARAAAVAEQAAKEQKAAEEQAAAAAEKKGSKAKTLIQLKKEEFDAIAKLLKAQKEIDRTAIDRQQLDGTLTEEQAKLKVKELELETQKKLTAEFLRVFKATREGDTLVSFGFQFNKDEIAGLQTEFQNSLQSEIALTIALRADPKDVEKDSLGAIKRIEEVFKNNAKALAEGVLDPDAFQQASDGLRGSFEAIQKKFEEALNDPKVKADPRLLDAYTEQIQLIKLKIGELGTNTSEELGKATQKLAQEQVARNKRRLDLLQEDEAANAAEIRQLLLENVDLETNIKLAGLRSTGEIRRQETELILKEAERSVDGIEKKFGSAGDGLGKGLALSLAGAFSRLDFSGAFSTLKEGATESINAAIDSIKKGAVTYQEAIATIGAATESGVTFVTYLMEQLATVFGQVRQQSLDALGAVSQGFADGKKTMDEVLQAMASSAVSGFAELLVAQEEYGRGSILLLLDILSATIPALVALIYGKAFAEDPLLGAVVGSATTAALLGLVAVAKAAAQGFESGGYTGNVGTSTVAGVVHGQEYVVNAQNTKKFRPILEQMNRGSMPIIDTGEFAAMRSELTAIRQTLAGMPNGIQGRQAVSVDVGMDTYLYERDRRRASVRGLRG